MKEHTIDASSKKLGRVASEAASILMGKDVPTFAKNKTGESKVTITNASKLVVSSKKLNDKVYKRYSGYPGGLKTETLAHLADKHGMGEALRKAVYGMLPTNKLRPRRMKNLIITE